MGNYAAAYYAPDNVPAADIDPSDLRLDVDRGDGVKGTLAVPSASQTLIGVNVDATVGNVVLPAVDDVRNEVMFGPASSSTGILIVGDPEDPGEIY